MKVEWWARLWLGICCLGGVSNAFAQVEEIDPMYDEVGEPLDERPDFEEDNGIEPPAFDALNHTEGESEAYESRDGGGLEPSPSMETEEEVQPSTPTELDDPLNQVQDSDFSDPAIFDRTDLPAFHQRSNEYSLNRRDAMTPRSYWWPQLLSIPLPGFGQWYDGQYEWATGYSAIGVAGLGFALANVPKGKGEDESDADYQNRHLFGVKERKYVLGLQFFQGSGGLSAYHSFRTAVRSRQPLGQFLFLQEEERISDILLAPFEWRFLTRPSTFVPLAIGGALYFFTTEFYNEIDPDLSRRKLEGSDVFFASTFSYNAGTHEEAVFRGWVQPMFFHLTSGSSTWSNVITSGIFAAAHLPSNPAPLPQFLLSLHLGWVTERNQWTLAESVFIHTWWDVIAFLAQYQVMLKEGSDSKINPALHLPPIEFRF